MTEEHRDKGSREDRAGDAPRLALLAPKLRLPQPRSALVVRERLFRLLDMGLEHRLTLLSAPAGFGKTTLVSQWVNMRGQGGFPPVAWFALDAGDNDPTRFWQYLLEACGTFRPGSGRAGYMQTFATQPSLPENAVTALLNELTILTAGGILVLEDYHLITSPQIHNMMTLLIDHLPPLFHIVLMTRSDPPLPLSRWRVSGDLNEVQANDLRFSSEETRRFLRLALSLPLSQELVASLEAHAEGWAAGLRLVALALHDRTSQGEVERFISTFSGGHRRILEYLVTEVFSEQPEDLQQFLLQTTILDKLTGSLCAAITGRSDSGLLLEQLERANLFLVPLDEAGQWYRYHTLFAEAMQSEASRRLGEAHLRTLYARASDWYEEHALLHDAVEAAIKARDYRHVLFLISRIVGPQHFSEAREYYTLRRWLEHMPEEVLAIAPDFCFMYATLYLFVPEQAEMVPAEQFEKLLRLAEQAWRDLNKREKLGEVVAARALVAMRQEHLEQAQAYASQALAQLPEDELVWRGIVTSIFGRLELHNGRLNLAQERLQEASILNEKAGNEHSLRSNLLMQATIYRLKGRLRRASDMYRQVVIAAEKDQVDRGRALLGLATIAYERNDREQADHLLEEILERGRSHLDEATRVEALLIKARLLYVRKQRKEGQRLLAELADEAIPRQSLVLYRRIQMQEARMHYSLGDLMEVQRWISTYALEVDGAVPVLQREQEALLVVRIKLAQGERVEALRRLAYLRREAHEAGRGASEQVIDLLTALAYFQEGQTQEASKLVGELLAAAYLEEQQRLFLDEGEAVVALLRACLPYLKEEALALYLRMLLSAFAKERAESTRAVPQLIEPLSQQELRVLSLLAAGRSNPEMAQELIVSVNTIKAHIKSIYRKLDVHNRVEALKIAKHLQLL